MISPVIAALVSASVITDSCIVHPRTRRPEPGASSASPYGGGRGETVGHSKAAKRAQKRQRKARKNNR